MVFNADKPFRKVVHVQPIESQPGDTSNSFTPYARKTYQNSPLLIILKPPRRNVHHFISLLPMESIHNSVKIPDLEQHRQAGSQNIKMEITVFGFKLVYFISKMCIIVHFSVSDVLLCIFCWLIEERSKNTTS